VYLLDYHYLLYHHYYRRTIVMLRMELKMGEMATEKEADATEV
jgi:hypothetical protein